MRYGVDWKHNWVKWLVPVVLVVVWEGLSKGGFISASLLPAPTKVIATWADWLLGITGTSETNSGRWIVDALSSGFRVLIGYMIAAISGITLGIAIGWWRIVEILVEPTIQLLRPIPPVSWIPLAIIWFGIADRPAIFLVFLGAFFPILMNTMHGVRAVDKNLFRAAAMMGATQWQMIRHVLAPAALPSIFAGLRIGVGSAWMLTVTAEMVAVKSGLGYVLWDSYYFLRYDLVIASMASIGLLGFLTDWIVKKLMYKVLHWQIGSSVEGLHAN